MQIEFKGVRNCYTFLAMLTYVTMQLGRKHKHLGSMGKILFPKLDDLDWSNHCIMFYTIRYVLFHIINFLYILSDDISKIQIHICIFSQFIFPISENLKCQYSDLLSVLVHLETREAFQQLNVEIKSPLPLNDTAHFPIFQTCSQRQIWTRESQFSTAHL